MMLKMLIKFLIIISLVCSNNILNAEIKNKIIVKVGSRIISSVALENEIRTLIFLNKEKMTQENIDKAKDIAVKELIRRSIKNQEIKNFNETNYNKKDLNKALENLANAHQTTKGNLKKMFIKNNCDYDTFVNSIKTNYMWNTLIFKLYKNQISINSVEIENELKGLVEENKNLTEIKLSEIVINNSENTQNKLNKIFKTIREEGFNAAVKIYSTSDTITKNGNIGWFNKKSLSPIFLEKLKSLKKGDITSPIISETTTLILKITDTKVIRKNYNEAELGKAKDDILKKQKDEKLQIFSRSHFSKLENKIIIKFL